MTYPWEKPERNRELTLRLLRGDTCADLARHFGLCRSTVAGIAHRLCRRAAPDAYDEVIDPGAVGVGVLAVNAERFVDGILNL